MLTTEPWKAKSTFPTPANEHLLCWNGASSLPLRGRENLCCQLSTIIVTWQGQFAASSLTRLSHPDACCLCISLFKMPCVAHQILLTKNGLSVRKNRCAEAKYWLDFKKIRGLPASLKMILNRSILNDSVIVWPGVELSGLPPVPNSLAPRPPPSSSFTQIHPSFPPPGIFEPLCDAGWC